MQGVRSHSVRIVAIVGLLLALVVSSVAWVASLLAIPWMLLVRWLPQLQPEAVTDPDRLLIIAAVLFLPLLIAARLSWIALERAVESYWMDQWQRWQAWKQQRLGPGRAAAAVTPVDAAKKSTSS